MRHRGVNTAALALTMVAAMAGCSAPSAGQPGEPPVQKVRNQEAYRMGQEDAAKLLLTVADEPATQDALLDARARITHIRVRVGEQAAVDYERGFTDKIRSDCDSLAALIF